MSISTRDQMIGICFMPARRGKPIGHAMLILPSQDDPNKSITIDYDGYGGPLIEDGAQSLLYGQVLFFRASPEQISRAHDYYNALEDEQPAPFYFNRGLEAQGKFALRGKTSTNCLHSIITILEEKAHIDMGFLQDLAHARYSPSKTSEAISKALTRQNNVALHHVYDASDVPMGIISQTLLGEGTDEDGDAQALWVTGLKGQFCADDLWVGKLYDGFTQYYQGSLAENVAQLKSNKMDIPELYQTFWKSAQRDQRFIMGQTAHYFRRMMSRNYGFGA